MILKICNEDQNDWDIFLPELSIDGCSIPENGLPNMTEKGVCLVVLWTIVRYENNNSGKKIT
jgi:hypothetical protein